MKVAINGFGRIGRTVFRIAIEKGYDVVAINDLTDIENLCYLLRFDSVHGRYNKKISSFSSGGLKGGVKKFIRVGNKKIAVYAERDPENLPWKQLKIDVVIESTGFYRDREGAEKHLKAGARKVIISAPGKNMDKTIVLGINEKALKKGDRIISMASCTTNCLAPIAKVLEDNFGIEKAFMTTVHAYTNDQKILDVPHKKIRRGRAAAQNFIPTSSGATKSVCDVIPSLKGKMDGLAIRGPVACGSIVDFVAILKKSSDVAKINDVMKKAANGKLKGILEYTEDEIVSSDVIGNPHSSIFDSKLTQVNGKIVKVLSWYDNEFGYSSRLVDLIGKLK